MFQANKLETDLLSVILPMASPIKWAIDNCNIFLHFFTSSLATMLSVIIILSIGDFSILSIAGLDKTPWVM